MSFDGSVTTRRKGKIPFHFASIPRYFLQSGWAKNPKVAVFLHYSFGRCQAVARTVEHDGKLVYLPPFSFIFGRREFSDECGLTEDEIRTIIKNLTKAKLLKKLPNKTPNRFTVYGWLTEAFSHSVRQQNPQQLPQHIPKSSPQIRKEKNEKNYQKDARPQPLNRKKSYS